MSNKSAILDDFIQEFKNRCAAKNIELTGYTYHYDEECEHLSICHNNYESDYDDKQSSDIFFELEAQEKYKGFIKHICRSTNVRQVQ
jgi:hypothetical protein